MYLDNVRRCWEVRWLSCKFFICMRRTSIWINVKFIFLIASKCKVWKFIFYEKQNYRFSLLSNKTMCIGTYFSHELPFQNVLFTKITFTHLFSIGAVQSKANLLLGKWWEVQYLQISIGGPYLWFILPLFVTLCSPFIRANLWTR